MPSKKIRNVSSKKRIALISPMAYGLFNKKSSIVFGGSEVQLTFLAKELAKECETYMLVANATAKSKPEVYSKVAVHSVFTLKKSIFNYLCAPMQLFSTLVRISPDVVIQRGAGAETGIGALYCLLYKKKFIFSIAHDIDVTGEFAKRGLIGKLYAFGMKHASAVIAQNADQISHLSKWLLNRKNVSLIKSMYPKSQSTLKKKKYILWVARSDNWKNPQLFLDLAQKIPSVPFVMIMPKSSDVHTWKTVSSRAKTLSNVTFIEHVAFENIQKYFSEAFLFVNTSAYEGFPNTFIQSCIGKTPIVSLTVNPDGMLESNAIGSCAQGSFEKLCLQVRSFIADPKKYHAYSENAYIYFLKNHSIDSNYALWKQIIFDMKPKQ